MRGKRGVLSVTFLGWESAPGFEDLFSGFSFWEQVRDEVVVRARWNVFVGFCLSVI
jgi:hypothetical protein